MSDEVRAPVTHVYAGNGVLKHLRELTIEEAREVIVRLCHRLELARAEIQDLKSQPKVRGHG
jgi:predicted DNA-binding antitoxin AbrB/MazE fold protein